MRFLDAATRLLLHMADVFVGRRDLASSDTLSTLAWTFWDALCAFGLASGASVIKLMKPVVRQCVPPKAAPQCAAVQTWTCHAWSNAASQWSFRVLLCCRVVSLTLSTSAVGIIFKVVMTGMLLALGATAVDVSSDAWSCAFDSTVCYGIAAAAGETPPVGQHCSTIIVFDTVSRRTHWVRRFPGSGWVWHASHRWPGRRWMAGLVASDEVPELAGATAYQIKLLDTNMAMTSGRMSVPIEQ